MPIENDTLMPQWANLDAIPACEEGRKLAQTFLEAAGECVNTLGSGRTSSSRAALLTAYNQMVAHGDKCQKCNEV